MLGNVTVVQSYTRLTAEMQAMRGLMDELLAAQYPVLTWWGLLTVLTRAAATIAMVLVFATGAVLAARGEIKRRRDRRLRRLRQLLIGQARPAVGLRRRRVPPGAAAGRPTSSCIDARSDALDAPARRRLPKVTGRVRYQDVTYRFPASDQGVFDLGFEAAPGETVALVGPTGAGKTTALALLQRLRQPDAGRILIDGKDIAGVTLTSLRGSIAVVFQDAGLFNRPIAENIRVGRPAATDAEVEAAARLAEAHDSSPPSPAATASSSASAATRCPAASASASPSPAPCSRTRPS